LPADTPLPINLPTALQLANVQPIDVSIASARIRLAAAQLDYAKLLWLPNIFVGTDYFRHDGEIQDTSGKILTNSQSSFMVGAGPYAVFGVTDAIFEPLAARQGLAAQNAALQTAQNDSLLAVAESYFTLQQTRGELAGAEDVLRRSIGLVYRTQRLAPALFPELEVTRARTQSKRSRQLVQTARERWRVTSANLTRILRLDSSALVEPLEPPHLQVTLIELNEPLQDLIAIGLTNRPELANQQALVRQTLERIRQEKMRPFLPGIYVRGASPRVTGTMAGGLFGGGNNDDMGNFGARFDIDVQVLWELKELGFGNHALIRQREAENEAARLELFRTQDTVAAQVAQAYAQAKSAAARLTDAEGELKDAIETANKNVQGLSETKSAGNVLIPIVRPQEVVASFQALAQAYVDYYGAVADYDRAQFRLYHALGHPAQAVASRGLAPAPPEPTPPAPAPPAAPAP
jgi:outer membrane protein TolC